MKKHATILFCAALLLFHTLIPTSSFAQSSAWVDATCSSSHNYGVVRNASPSQIVSSHLDSRGTTFTLVDMTPNVYEFLLSDVSVYDFQIAGGYVIFCGGNTTGNAVIGSFPVSGLSSVSPSPVLINYTEIPALTEISRVEVFGTGAPGMVHMVMIEDAHSYQYPIYGRKVVECDYDYALGSSGLLAFDYAFVVGGDTNYATDIVVTDSNVILIGTDGRNGILMRRCPKSTVFASPQSDYIYSYSLPNTPELQSIIGTYMGNGVLATANPSYLNFVKWRMHVRLFDIASMNMKHSQSIELEDKTTPRSLLYLKDVDSLVLLQHHAYVANYSTESDLIAFKPFAPANYTVTARWPSDPRTLVWACKKDERSVVAVASLYDFWFHNNYALNTPSLCRKSAIKECLIEPTIEFKLKKSPMSASRASGSSLPRPISIDYGKF